MAACAEAREAARRAGRPAHESYFTAWAANHGLTRKLRVDDTLVHMLFEASPPTIATRTLCRVLRCSRAALRTSLAAARRRHRAGLCLLWGADCPARGEASTPARAVADARRGEMQRLWREGARANFAALAPDT